MNHDRFMNHDGRCAADTTRRLRPARHDRAVPMFVVVSPAQPASCRGIAKRAASWFDHKS